MPFASTLASLSRAPSPTALALALALALGLAQPGAARADSYTLAAGDQLELVVVRLPQLTGASTISVDGEISFPLVGSIEVAGRSLAEARELVRAALANKVLDGFDPAQPSAMVLLDPEEVDLRVATYRPVLLDGDVENRGAIAFRPGMTVRQAVVEAGGYAVDRYLLEDQGASEADLRGRYEQLWIGYVGYSWRIWSLENELGEPDPVKPVASDFKLENRVFDLVGATEVKRMAERKTAFDTLIESLTVRRQKASERLTLLEKQLEEEKKATDFDREELERAEGLLARGVGTRDRVADIRRTLLLSNSRFLEVQSQLAAFEQEAAITTQALATAQADRRVALLDELTEAQRLRAVTRSEIEAMAERLKRKTAARAAQPLGTTGRDVSNVSVTIFRVASGERIENADANEAVMPGDVVDVRLPALPLMQ